MPPRLHRSIYVYKQELFLRLWNGVCGGVSPPQLPRALGKRRERGLGRSPSQKRILAYFEGLCFEIVK